MHGLRHITLPVSGGQIYPANQLSEVSGLTYVSLTVSVFTTHRTMSKPIKVGIAGYGSAARTFHLPFIVPHPDDYEVVAIYQRSPPTEGKRHCTTDYPKIKWYSEIEPFLADKNVELVIVITPHRENAHYTVAKAAVLANKHGA